MRKEKGLDELAIAANYCHDDMIKEVARWLGISDRAVVNEACSIGEGPYDSFHAAVEFLMRKAQKMKKIKGAG